MGQLSLVPAISLACPFRPWRWIKSRKRIWIQHIPQSLNLSHPRQIWPPRSSFLPVSYTLINSVSLSPNLFRPFRRAFLLHRPPLFCQHAGSLHILRKALYDAFATACVDEMLILPLYTLNRIGADRNVDNIGRF